MKDKDSGKDYQEVTVLPAEKSWACLQFKKDKQSAAKVKMQIPERVGRSQKTEEAKAPLTKPLSFTTVCEVFEEKNQNN